MSTTSQTVRRSRSDFRRYSNMSRNFSSMITNVDSSLNEAVSKLNKVNEILVVTDKTNDLLTFNVISGTEDIKNKVNTIDAQINNYDGAVKIKADELDTEEYQQYLAQLRSEENDQS